MRSPAKKNRLISYVNGSGGKERKKGGKRGGAVRLAGDSLRKKGEPNRKKKKKSIKPRPLGGKEVAFNSGGQLRKGKERV